MKNIRKKFNPYYSSQNHAMKLDQFIMFEMALMVLLMIKKDVDPKKGYIIFTKYHTIGNWENTPDNYILQNASILLKQFRSEKIWNNTLKEYNKDEYEGIRLFDCDDQIVHEKNTTNIVYANRKDDYMWFITTYSQAKSGKYATCGNYRYINKNNEDRVVNVYIDEDMDEDFTIVSHEASPRPKIEISMDSLMEAAMEMKQILPNDHCLDVLKNNTIKESNNGAVGLATKLEIDKIANIVGMVGAGKTTLLKVLAYILDKRNKKTAIVTDTVAEVFNLYRYFSSLGCKVSPLIGKTERLKYINQIISEDAYYLDGDISKYMTTNCLIDGYDVNNENAVPFGEEPCTKLEHGKSKYVCPYYNFCPATEMQRNAITSNIVITTVPGMVMSRVGKKNSIFLSQIMDGFDVVFYDECDRVQKNLDDVFTPATKFNSFINECAADYYQFMLESNEKRMENVANMYYAELQAKSPTVLGCVSNAVKSAKKCGSKGVLSNTFSAYTLLDELKEDISPNIYNEIVQLMDYDHPELSSLFDIMISTCESIKPDRFDMLFDIWMDKNAPELALEDVSHLEENIAIPKEVLKKNKKNLEIRTKIQLILTLIFFDKFIMDIGDAFEESRDITIGYNELVQFIRTRFTAQQDYLPSALMGNIFGVKATNDDDVLLYRQYAYGRALLTNLPYLRVNREGRPIGPHVVLLSGSSYAKGSYEYHVNAEVNYIIEADKSVREFIANTQFVELGLEDRVSGSPLSERDEILQKVVDKCTLNIISELEKEGKILLVVNSFSQAKVVASHLRANLNKRGCKEEVCALISDKNIEEEDSSKYLRRGEVHKFDKERARILVAPALAIERGHNIVDEHGHSSLSSVFFLIRPMGIPDDVKEKSIKMNGYIAMKMHEYHGSDLYEKSLYIRQEAIKFWFRMNNSAKRALDNISDIDIKRDIVATIFVLILQIFGRLCRVTDSSKNPPTVYFVDGAFRKKSDAKDGFDTLNELYIYMRDMLEDSEHGEIARTLYEPFFKAYEGGISHE